MGYPPATGYPPAPRYPGDPGVPATPWYPGHPGYGYQGPPARRGLPGWAVALIVVGSCVAGLALLGLLGLGFAAFAAQTLGDPSAEDCDATLRQRADGLLADPLFTTLPDGGRALGAPYVYCTEESPFAGQSYVASLGPSEVIGHYERAFEKAGWTVASRADEPEEGSSAMCLSRRSDDGTYSYADLYLDDVEPATTHYTLELNWSDFEVEDWCSS